MYFPFIFMVIIFIFMMAAVSASNEKAQRQIREYQSRRGNRVIDISSQYNRTPRTYQVKYVTPKNETYKIRCAVIGTYSELYWSEPELQRPIPERQLEQQSYQSSGANLLSAEVAVRSDKERLIDGLTSGFKYERILTVREVGALPSVDELVLYIVNDMANDDPEPEVREAAKQTIHKIESTPVKSTA